MSSYAVIALRSLPAHERAAHPCAVSGGPTSLVDSQLLTVTGVHPKTWHGDGEIKSHYCFTALKFACSPTAHQTKGMHICVSQRPRTRAVAYSSNAPAILAFEKNSIGAGCPSVHEPSLVPPRDFFVLCFVCPRSYKYCSKFTHRPIGS